MISQAPLNRVEITGNPIAAKNFLTITAPIIAGLCMFALILYWTHSVPAALVAGLLFGFDPAQNPVSFPSPRSWEYAHRALIKFTDAPHLLCDALQACVGQAAGVECKAFLDHMAELPDIEAILQGGSEPVPQAIDLQYGVAAALVNPRVADHGELL